MGKAVEVLMVEDSEADAELVLAALAPTGLQFHSRRVETEAALIAALSGCFPDIVLSDYMLPEFDGSRALEVAREHCPDVPFIFVSGVMGEEIAIDSLKHGATDYVLKHRLERLWPAVNRALKEAHERTERRRAETELRVTGERLGIALNAARLGMWELDLETFELSCSATCRENVGFKPDANLTYQSFRSVIHPDDLSEVDRRVRAAIEGDGYYEAEYRVCHPDDSIHWISAYGRVMDRTGGRPGRIVGVTQDISARKHVEQNLEGQTRELERLNEDLRQLTYAATHDLREPLRMVSIYAELLIRRHREELGPKAEQFFQHIKTGTVRMEALLRDMLTFTRLDRAENGEVVDLDKLVANVIELMIVPIQETSAQISVDPLPSLRCAESQIAQVFENLIGNALKYRGKDTPEIRIHSEKLPGEWKFTVEDNGLGFDQKYADMIFGLFKRLYSSEYSGTGLGLAICKRIVERHGGRIWAKSIEGSGSTFYFTLPA